MSEMRVIATNEVEESSQLADPLFMSLYKFWNEMRDGKALPRVADFDILNLEPVVWPYLIYADVIGEPADFHYRVTGTEVDLANGFNSRGMILSSLPNMNTQVLLKEFRRMVQRGRPRRSEGVFITGDSHFESVSRLVCPLADDTGQVVRLLGAVRFVWKEGESYRNRSGIRPRRIFE